MSGSAGKRLTSTYELRITGSAAIAFRQMTSLLDFEQAESAVRLLEAIPEIGRCYDANYAAARPPMSVMVVYAGNYGIYYTVEEKAKRVTVRYIEDQRRDPFGRFS